MNIHFLRNATLIIQSGAHHILVDSMLGRKGSLPPYTFLRYQPRLNPLVDLPESANEALAGVTAVHGHNLVGKLMGPGVGYIIRLPGEPTLYLRNED